MGGLDESHRELVEKASLGKHSIFQVADECDKLFDEFSQKSTETGQKLAPDFPKASSVEEVPLTYRVGEFHSRFRAWASYLGVFAGEHMNLDARLRERPELADIVLLTMDKLRANLQDLLSAEQPPAPSETDVEDGDSSSSSSWGIVDDSGDNQQNNLRDFIIGCIRESVGKLNRLAIVIRSSASISTPSDFFARVRRYAARHLAQDMASLETSFNHTLQFLYPNADDCFRRQLLKSALFRFAKLRYWQSHPEDQESDTRQIEEPTLGSSLDKGTPDVDDVSQKGTEDRKETVPITAAASSTNLSVTKAPVKIEEPEVPIVHSETRSQRREGTSVWMSTAQYPETPPVLLNPSNDQTVCPYCYKRQEDEIFTDKESWEHHIDEDLEPFVCIFETCGETASFSNFQDWRRHLRQVHTDDWLWQISPEPAYRCNHPSHFESDPDARPEDRSDNNIVISSFADIQDHFEKNHGQIISIPKAEDVYLDHPFPFTSLLLVEVAQKCAEWAEQFGAFGEVASGFHVRYNHEFTKMQALQHVLLDPEKFKLGKPLIELMEKERQHDIRDVLLCILREVQSFETLVSKYGAREVEENGKNADSQGVIDVSKIALEEALPDLVERERFVQTKTICIKRPFGPQRALWASTGKKAAEKSLSRIHEWLQLVRDEIDQFFWTFKIPENTKKGTSDKLKSLAADADLVTLTLSNPMRMRQLALQLEMPPEEIDDTFPSNMMTDAAAKKQARAAEQERETQRQQAEAVDNLRDILKKRNLAICVGSGVTLYSVSTETKPRLTWTGLVNNGFDYLERELPDFYQQQKKAFERARELLDDDKATAGDLIEAASKLNSFFQSHPGKLADWLSHQFEKLPHYVNSPAVLESLKKLHRNGALLMTTNYDGLMEKHCDLSPLDSSDKDKLMEFNRRLCDGVFHPHGYWKNPKHIVLDAIDYYKVRHDDGVQETLRNIFTERTILFVGCGGGLADPNFGELLKWLGEKQKNIGSSHYILLPKDELNPMPQLPLKHVRCEGYDAIGPWLENLLDQSERSDRVVEHRLRVVTTVQWHIDPEQLIPRDGLSKAAPALATMGDTLFAVWCGRNNDNNNLYWSSCRYSGDKPIWSKPKKLHERALSAERPAIAAMEDQLVVSWKAVSNDCLWYSTRRIGSQDWMIPNKIPGAGSSAGPSLALWKLNSTTRVYALWKGISAPADQHVYWTYYDGEKWYPKKALHAISTNVSPNLVCCRGKIYVAWKDKKTEKIFWACVDEDAAMSDIRAKVLHTNARTNRAPALAKVDGVIYALWKGQGNSTDMWLALLPEGEDEFKPAQIVEKMKTTVAPTLVGWDNRLVLAWKAIGNQYQMWWIYGGVRTEQSISS
ncbi:hypothetical protein H9L39_16557 [Fusarium oxysporum f. sp. albedinis]|nr:hypothetical protein H9L39_16557 [Fusarium oxysporum f. sp. albedinis]